MHQLWAGLAEMGQRECSSFDAWNTYVEEIIRKEPANKRPVSGLESVKKQACHTE